MEWSRFMLTFCSCEHSLHKKTTANPAESAAPLAQVLSLRSYILVFYFSITILYLSLQYSGFNNMPCIPPLQVSSVVLVHRCDYSLILSRLPIALGPGQKFSLPELSWMPELFVLMRHLR